jgi:hypothetical protein
MKIVSPEQVGREVLALPPCVQEALGAPVASSDRKYQGQCKTDRLAATHIWHNVARRYWGCRHQRRG